MPELPEVETTIKCLKIIKNTKIIKISTHTKKLRYLIPNSLNKTLKNKKIVKLKRIGKYIMLEFNNNFTVVLHLGMSGRLKIVEGEYLDEKHDHIIFYFNNGKKLIFNDQRKFGFIDIDRTEKIHLKKYVTNLGVDALSKKLTSNYIYNKICKSDVIIKQILLNQHIVAGIGNIYASEILFDAKISPFVKGKEIKISHIIRLIKSINKILKKAIRFGGSSIRNYKASDGTLGNFQSNFKVYNKEGKKISNFLIKKITHHGRSTYFCPEIQKEQNSN